VQGKGEEEEVAHLYRLGITLAQTGLKPTSLITLGVYFPQWKLKKCTTLVMDTWPYEICLVGT